MLIGRVSRVAISRCIPNRSFKGLRFLEGSRDVGRSDASIVPTKLEEQRDTPKMGNKEKDKDKGKEDVSRDILILDPRQTIDKKYRRIVNMHTDEEFGAYTRMEPVMLDLNTRNLGSNMPSDDAIHKTIHMAKPESEEVTKLKYKKLLTSLIKSFTRKQLLDYVMEEGVSHKKLGLSKLKKKQLVSQILDHIWKLKVCEKISTLDDLLVTHNVLLGESEIFLFSLKGDRLVLYIERVGVKISLDINENRVYFRGTENQVLNAELLLNRILSKLAKESVNLSLFKKLFIEKFGTFPLKTLGRYTGVYFRDLGNENYELVAFGSNQIKKCKRLLIWLLDYKCFYKDFLLPPTDFSAVEAISFKDDDSLPWDKRERNLFFFESAALETIPDSLKNDLKRFLNENLQLTDFDLLKSIGEMQSLASEQNDSSFESWDLLRQLGIVETNTEKTEDRSSGGKDELHINVSSHLLEDIFQKITDFSYRRKLCGVLDDKLNIPIFSSSVGKILFEAPANHVGKADKIIPSFQKSSYDLEKFMFTSNVQLLNDYVSSLSLYDSTDLDARAFNHFISHDPHNYIIQILFMPSPFLDAKDLECDNQSDFMKFPPVQLTADLNNFFKPDLDTLNLVTVEGENYYHLSLPNAKADLRICCQLSGNLLDENTEIGKSYKSHDDDALEKKISDILKSTTSKYKRFDSQPGLVTFLSNSNISFNGRTSPTIAPHIDLNINGHLVRYYYVSISLKRQLDLCFENESRKRLLQYASLEGGSLGGRHLEVDLIGNLEADSDKKSFDLLLDDSLQLVNRL